MNASYAIYSNQSSKKKNQNEPEKQNKEIQLPAVIGSPLQTQRKQLYMYKEGDKNRNQDRKLNLDIRNAESPQMNKKFNLHISLEPNEMRNAQAAEQQGITPQQYSLEQMLQNHKQSELMIVNNPHASGKDLHQMSMIEDDSRNYHQVLKSLKTDESCLQINSNQINSPPNTSSGVNKNASQNNLSNTSANLTQGQQLSPHIFNGNLIKRQETTKPQKVIVPIMMDKQFNSPQHPSSPFGISTSALGPCMKENSYERSQHFEFNQDLRDVVQKSQIKSSKRRHVKRVNKFKVETQPRNYNEQSQCTLLLTKNQSFRAIKELNNEISQKESIGDNTRSFQQLTEAKQTRRYMTMKRVTSDLTHGTDLLASHFDTNNHHSAKRHSQRRKKSPEPQTHISQEISNLKVLQKMKENNLKVAVIASSRDLSIQEQHSRQNGQSNIGTKSKTHIAALNNSVSDASADLKRLKRSYTKKFQDKSEYTSILKIKKHQMEISHENDQQNKNKRQYGQVTLQRQSKQRIQMQQSKKQKHFYSSVYRKGMKKLKNQLSKDLQSIEMYRSSTDESYSGATNSSEEEINLSQEDHAELAKTFVEHSLISRERRKRNVSPKHKGKTHNGYRQLLNQSHSHDSEENEMCGCQRQQQQKQIIEKLGIHPATLTNNFQDAIFYSKVENFQPTCMQFVKQCYPKQLTQNKIQLEEAVALSEGVRQQLSRIKLTSDEKAAIVQSLRMQMGLDDDNPTQEATPQLTTIKTETQQQTMTNDSYQIVSSNPDILASNSRKTVYNSVNQIKASKTNSLSKSPKRDNANQQDLSSTADPVTPDLPSNLKDTVSRRNSNEKSNANIIIQDNNQALEENLKLVSKTNPSMSLVLKGPQNHSSFLNHPELHDNVIEPKIFKLEVQDPKEILIHSSDERKSSINDSKNQKQFIQIKKRAGQPVQIYSQSNLSIREEDRIQGMRSNIGGQRQFLSKSKSPRQKEAKKHYIQANVSPPKSNEGKSRLQQKSDSNIKTNLQKLHFSDLNNTLNATMRKRFNKIEINPNKGQRRGTLRKEDIQMKLIESLHENQQDELEEEYISEPDDDVTQTNQSLIQDGDNSQERKNDKQISIEEDGRTTWRKPHETILGSKISVVNSGSTRQTKMNWDLKFDNSSFPLRNLSKNFRFHFNTSFADKNGRSPTSSNSPIDLNDNKTTSPNLESSLAQKVNPNWFKQKALAYIPNRGMVTKCPVTRQKPLHAPKPKEIKKLRIVESWPEKQKDVQKQKENEQKAKQKELKQVKQIKSKQKIKTVPHQSPEKLVTEKTSTQITDKKNQSRKNSSNGEKQRSSIHLSLPKETKTNFIIAQQPSNEQKKNYFDFKKPIYDDYDHDGNGFILNFKKPRNQSNRVRNVQSHSPSQENETHRLLSSQPCDSFGFNNAYLMPVMERVKQYHNVRSSGRNFHLSKRSSHLLKQVGSSQAFILEKMDKQKTQFYDNIPGRHSKLIEIETTPNSPNFGDRKRFSNQHVKLKSPQPAISQASSLIDFKKTSQKIQFQSEQDDYNNKSLILKQSEDKYPNEKVSINSQSVDTDPAYHRDPKEKSTPIVTASLVGKDHKNQDILQNVAILNDKSLEDLNSFQSNFATVSAKLRKSIKSKNNQQHIQNNQVRQYKSNLQVDQKDSSATESKITKDRQKFSYYHQHPSYDLLKPQYSISSNLSNILLRQSANNGSNDPQSIEIFSPVGLNIVKEIDVATNLQQPMKNRKFKVYNYQVQN